MTTFFEAFRQFKQDHQLNDTTRIMSIGGTNIFVAWYPKLNVGPTLEVRGGNRGGTIMHLQLVGGEQGHLGLYQTPGGVRLERAQIYQLGPDAITFAANDQTEAMHLGLDGSYSGLGILALTGFYLTMPELPGMQEKLRAANGLILPGLINLGLGQPVTSTLNAAY